MQSQSKDHQGLARAVDGTRADYFDWQFTNAPTYKAFESHPMTPRGGGYIMRREHACWARTRSGSMLGNPFPEVQNGWDLANLRWSFRPRKPQQLVPRPISCDSSQYGGYSRGKRSDL